MTSETLPQFNSAQVFEVASLAEVKDEIFGPVLQIVRWGSGELKSPEAVIARINALGYGLTLGIQTRIDSRAQALAAAAHVGNIYVNRNMIGAVVGVQPFHRPQGRRATLPIAFLRRADDDRQHQGGGRQRGAAGWCLTRA